MWLLKILRLVLEFDKGYEKSDREIRITGKHQELRRADSRAQPEKQEVSHEV